MSKLETREKRSRLAPRREPYYEKLARGVALGYRRHSGGTGAWVARRWDALSERYTEEPLGPADDAGGDDLGLCLPYRVAKARALADPAKVKAKSQRAAERKVTDFTCLQAVTAYVEWQTREGKASAPNAKAYCHAYVEQMPWGGKALFAMKPSEFRRWRDAMLARKPAADAEALRARRASVNRILTMLRAAFERAADQFEQDELPVAGRPWRIGLEKFVGVTGRRTTWLDTEQQRTLLKHCDAELHDVVHLLFLTGFRPSEALSLNVADFDPRAGALYVRRTKVGRADWLPLNAEGRALCSRLVAGRATDAPLLVTLKSRAAGRWHIRELQKRLKVATAKAGLSNVTAYTARHSFGAAMVADGVHSGLVAAMLGHTSSRMTEQHYQHFRDTAAAQAIEAMPTIVEPAPEPVEAVIVPIKRARARHVH
jgi:integrase